MIVEMCHEERMLYMTKYLPGDGTWKKGRIRIQETECTHELMADQTLKFLCSALRW